MCSVHVIAKPAIDAAAAKHPDARDWLYAWLAIASKATWTNLLDVRTVYPAADQFQRCLIFDAKGNNYRLIVRATYADKHQRGTLLVKEFLTHAEYDKDGWKGCCT
jgi:mRNA interferase HigB